MNKKIAGVGEILWDVYPNARFLGGATANFAFHAGNLGEIPIIVSRVGNDRDGDEILAEVRKRGADPSFIQRDKTKPTGRVQIRLDSRGVPSFICAEDEAFDYLAWTPEMGDLASEVDAVLFGTLAQRQPLSRQTIQKFVRTAARALKLFDPNLREFPPELRPVVEKSLHLTDILKLNEDEFDSLLALLGKKGSSRQEFFGWLLEAFHLKGICLTLGEKGACFYSREGEFYSPGIKIEPVDTTGSGDAFVAAWTVKWLSGASIGETLDFANGVAAFVATRPGAVPAYSLAEVEEFLKAHPERNVDASWAE